MAFTWHHGRLRSSRGLSTSPYSDPFTSHHSWPQTWTSLVIAGGVTKVNLPFSSRRGAWRNAVFTSTVAQPQPHWDAFDTRDLVLTVHSPPAATSASSFLVAWLPQATSFPGVTSMSWVLKLLVLLPVQVRWPCASRGNHIPLWLVCSIQPALFELHPR